MLTSNLLILTVSAGRVHWALQLLSCKQKKPAAAGGEKKVDESGESEQ